MIKKNDQKLKTQFRAIRKRIDAADYALLKALSNRFKEVTKVGVIKRKLNLPIHQKARWAEVVEDRLRKAKKLKLSEGFTRSLLQLIHDEALDVQLRKKK